MWVIKMKRNCHALKIFFFFKSLHTCYFSRGMFTVFFNKLYSAHRVLASQDIKRCSIFLSSVSQYHQTPKGRDYSLYSFSQSDVIFSDVIQSFQNLEYFVQHGHLNGRLCRVGLVFQCETLCVAFQQILA